MNEPKLYRIDLHRTEFATVYVLAADDESAIEDARQVVGVTDWFSDSEPDASSTPADGSHGSSVWSGGPDGEWLAPR